MPRPTDEWIGTVGHTVSRIPPRVRLRLFNETRGRCRHCSRKIRPGERWECDHMVPLINGGEHREANLQVLCSWCHRAKTREDVAEKAKTYRKRKANLGVKKPRSIRAWRRFDGTPVYAPRERT